MSMTREISRMHDEYAAANAIIREAVDSGYSAVRNLFIEKGFDVANDDRAEELVVAIYKYLIDSTEPTA